jgi:hypothetical protein
VDRFVGAAAELGQLGQRLGAQLHMSQHLVREFKQLQAWAIRLALSVLGNESMLTQGLQQAVSCWLVKFHPRAGISQADWTVGCADDVEQPEGAIDRLHRTVTRAPGSVVPHYGTPFQHRPRPVYHPACAGSMALTVVGRPSHTLRRVPDNENTFRIVEH